MRGINKTILVGNLGKDPEVKILADNLPIAKFSLATTETYRLKTGQTETKTEWHTIIAWRGLATLAQSFLHKGSLVYVEGKLRYRKYTDAGGQQHYVTEIVAEQLVILDKKDPAKPQYPPNPNGNDDPLPF